MTKKYNVRKVAQDLGLSPSSVYLALNKKPGVNEERREKILEYCERVGYHPRAGAGRRGVAGGDVCVLSKWNDCPSDISITSFMAPGSPIYYVQGFVEKMGAHLIMNFYSDEEVRNNRLPRVFQKELKGLLISCNVEDTEYVRLLARQGIPLVVMTLDIVEPQVDCVLVDDFNAAKAAVNFLIARGHRRIAHLAGNCKHPGNHLRTVAYRDALSDVQIPLRAELVSDDLEESSIEAGYKGAMQIMRSVRGEVDAFFCVTDDLAVGCYRALTELGLRVPEDVSLMGFDDKTFLSHLVPGLTTVHIPNDKIHRVAVRRLFELMDPETEEPEREPRTILLPGTIIERQTVTAKTPSNAKKSSRAAISALR